MSRINLPKVPSNIREPNDDAILWRYIDFPQLYSLLETHKIILTHPSKFDDLLEGAFTKYNENSYINNILNSEDESIENEIGRLFFLNEDAFPQICNSLYVSCWHENHVESTLMWKVYSSMHKGIVIKTTYLKLKKLFNENFYIGKVKYINNYTEVPTNQIFRFFYKREEYAGENEVRAIYVNWQALNHSDNGLEKEYYSHRIDNSDFIDEIILSPYSNIPFIENVVNLANKHNVKCKISALSAENPKKIKALIYNIGLLLSQKGNKNCENCKGNGYTTNNLDNVGFKFSFCSLCNAFADYVILIKDAMKSYITSSDKLYE